MLSAERVETLRNALDHIMRVARQGISPTKRLDWIEIRARYALEGKQWSPDIRETPRDSVKKMEKDFANCRAELLALRQQQEGILAAMRDELQIDENGDNNCGEDPMEGWETGLCAGYRVAYNVLKKLLAASEEDQRGSAKHEGTLQSLCGLGEPRPTGQEISQPSGTAPAEQTSSVPHPSTLLHGIALGIEAAAKEHEASAARHKEAGDGTMQYYELKWAEAIRSLSPADIAAKNPTKDAAWLDAAGRL